MELLTDLSQLSAACGAGVAMCIGTFDGVHRGHQMLMEKTITRAHELGLRSLVFTFSEHPLTLLAPPHAPMLLTDAEEKAALIAEHGVDLCARIDFTPAFAATEAGDFLERVVAGDCRARYLACGRDFRFGARGAGDAEMLLARGAELGFEVEICEWLDEGGFPIKSTRIRQDLLEGKVEEAARLLGRPYALHGRVVRGDERGRTIGFPTINLEPSPRKLVPGHGVYAAQVHVGDGTWGGMLNIGVRPTFKGMSRTIETYLFDFSGDLYGREVRLDILRRVREERRFPSVEALIEQLKQDEQTCREILKNGGTTNRAKGTNQ